MNKNTFIFSFLLLSALPAFSQSGIDEVLRNIEENNPVLRTGIQLNKAQKLEAKTGIFLPNPTIEWEQLYAKGDANSHSGELAIVQTFDFPSVYTNKNKLSKLKSEASDFQYATTRQEVLLAAQQTCIEIIYLRREKQLLEQRSANTEKLTELYRKRLDEGDTNLLEYNKVRLEKLNIDNESRLNEIALRSQLEKLQKLNGGIAIHFEDSVFPLPEALPDYSRLEAEYLSADPSLQSLQSESESAQQVIKINRAKTLPKFEIGYRRDYDSDIKMNGFRVGVSIPFWENKNTVKHAKAQAEYAILQAATNRQSLKSTLWDLYLQAQALEYSRNEYARTLASQQNEELLRKALDAGQISLIDYFAELATLYDCMQNFLEIEKEYHDIVARLSQYKL